MAELRTKSYDVLIDVTKLLVTLASATLVFSATLLRDTQGTSLPLGGVVFAAYVALLASIICGVLVLYTSITTLAGAADNSPPDLERVPRIYVCMKAQWRFFLAAMGLVALYGLIWLGNTAGRT